MLKKYYAAAILSLVAIFPLSASANPMKLAQFKRIPGLQLPTQRIETYITGKIYLPDGAAELKTDANCTSIQVWVEKLVKNKDAGNGGGFNPTYIPKRVATVSAEGDIKRGYCDYKIPVILVGDYYLYAGAKYSNIWKNRPTSISEEVSAQAIDWINPLSDLSKNRDLKLYFTRPIS